MKNLISIILIVTIISLTGCGGAEISYEVTREHQLVVRNYLTLEPEAMDAGGRELLVAVMDYWTAQGFTPYPGVQEHEVGSIRTYAGGNSQGLAATMEAVMTEPQGPFTSVAYTHTSNLFWDSYHVELVLDLMEPINSEDLVILPAPDQEKFEDLAGWLEQMELNLTFTLPGAKAGGNARLVSIDAGSSTFEWTVRPDQVNHFSAVTREFKLSGLLLAAAILGTILLMALVLLAIRRKRKRSQESVQN